MQKKTKLITLLLLISSPILCCGDHWNFQLTQGNPLLHSSYNLNPNPRDKQFPDPNTQYDGNNSSHRGMAQWLTRSLDGLNKLALTYDDGPHPIRTPKLLDILKKYQVKATFFVMGELVKTYPQIAERIVHEGHILATHDWRHDNSNNESREVFKKGLRDSVMEVKSHYKEEETYYRFPYGAYGRASGYHHFNVLKELSLEIFNENCINFAFWDIDTSDWVSGMTPEDITETLFSNLDGGRAWRFRTERSMGRTRYIKEPYTINRPKGGGVVLMHDIHERTIQATELFLSQAVHRNIEFVLLKDVQEFSYEGVTCDL